MRWLLLLLVLAGVTFLATSPTAVACPLCRDAVAAPSVQGDDDEVEDPSNSAAAYNHSIYLMIAVPYLSLGIVSFLIYRGVKKNADYLRAHGKPAPGVTPPATPPLASPC